MSADPDDDTDDPGDAPGARAAAPPSATVPEDDPWAGTAMGTRAPHDRAAEAAVLGAMMTNRDAIGEVIGLLTPADYYVPAHAIVHAALIEAYGRGEPTEPVALLARLTATLSEVPGRTGKRSAADLVGGAPALFALYQAACPVGQVGYYAAIVTGHATRRHLAEAGQRVAQLATDPGIEPAELVDIAAAEVLKVGEARGTGEDYAPIAELLTPTLDEIEAIDSGKRAGTGVPTGYVDLDHLLHGYHPGQMIVVAARPAVGKSLVAENAVRHAAARGYPAALFALEMSATEVVTRSLSAEARVALQTLRGGGLVEDDWYRLSAAMTRLPGYPMFVDASPYQTIVSIRAKCRRLIQRHGLRLAVIDYLQLMSPATASTRRSESRQVEVSEISRGIKLLAKDLDIPIIVLAQLNRGPEQRSDKTPMLSDLRESGAIEQDADVVILLHREDAYDKESPRSGEVDLIVAKHRNGPTGTVTVAFQGHYARFTDMAAGERWAAAAERDV